MLDNFFPLYATVFIFSFTITLILEKKLIPALKEKAKQPIYSDGPKWHEKKNGTPTLGGLGFLTAVLFSLLLTFPFLLGSRGIDASVSLIITLGYAFFNSLVGILDDLKKLRKKQNKGLSAKEKLFLQFILAVLFLFLRRILLGKETELAFAFGNIDIGIFYYPLTAVILVGIINCANLTDGVDGLASSVAFAIGVSLLYISAALFEEVALLSSAIMGATVGFLIFNIHPAKIFMGDTGSLFFGALVAACTVMLKNPLISLFVAVVYIIEGISVILQVVYFKITGKRMLKMAPFHHHLERCGWSENKICIAAMLLTFITSIPAYVFYLP